MRRFLSFLPTLPTNFWCVSFIFMMKVKEVRDSAAVLVVTLVDEVTVAVVVAEVVTVVVGVPGVVAVVVALSAAIAVVVTVVVFNTVVATMTVTMDPIIVGVCGCEYDSDSDVVRGRRDGCGRRDFCCCHW